MISAVLYTAHELVSVAADKLLLFYWHCVGLLISERPSDPRFDLGAC